MLTPLERRIVEHLAEFVAPRRLARFREVLSLRTRHVTVVLEDVYREHNLSAVLRTCDAFGVQHVQVLERNTAFEVNRKVAMGADQWVTVTRRSGPASVTESWMSDLRERGFRIVATSPHGSATPISDLDITQPVALLFGNELAGVTDAALAAADELTYVPMYGMVESFNISVAAALCLHDVISRVRRTVPSHGLPEAEQERLLLEWLRNTVPGAGPIEARFLESQRTP